MRLLMLFPDLESQPVVIAEDPDKSLFVRVRRWEWSRRCNDLFFHPRPQTPACTQHLRPANQTENIAPMNYGIASRIFAGCTAAAAGLGLIVQFATTSQIYSAGRTLWLMLAYFTITTNLLVAIVVACIALNRTALRSPWIIAGTTLSIAMVGVVYSLLLRGTVELSGSAVLADKLLHDVTPVLASLFWILFAHKGGLTRRHPLLWAIYPLTYFVYGMTRGLITGIYAYPFLNIQSLGWQRTFLNALFLIAAFIAAGYAIVWIDQKLATKHPHKSRPLQLEP